MRGSRNLVLALTCALLSSPILAADPPVAATAAAPASSAAPAPIPATASSAPPAAAAPVSREQALLAFQSDLVSVMAPRADALPLMGAALMARSLPNQTRLNSFHSLIGRAAQASDAGPAVSWVRLGDCNEKASDCPNRAALAQLIQQAPDNAAVWMLKLGVDESHLKKADVRQDLAKAAAAKIYDDYTGVALKALADGAGLLPPPADTMDPNSQAGASGVQAIIVYGNAAAMPQVDLRATAAVCEKGANDPAIKADCLKLGLLLEWGSSPLARSLGLHLRETLNSDPAQQQGAEHDRRTLVWQVQNFAELSVRAQTEKPLAQHLLSLARTGGTQMSVVFAALRDDGIPIEPPADWQPKAAQ